MTDDPRLQQQLQGLIGKVETQRSGLIRQEKIFSTQILNLGVKLLAMLPVVETAHIETLDGDVVLFTESPVLHVLDTNGGDRTVRLPEPSGHARFLVIINSGT